MDVELKQVHHIAKDAIEGGFMALGKEEPAQYHSWHTAGNCKTCGMPFFSKVPYDSNGPLLPIVHRTCSCWPVNQINWPPQFVPNQQIPVPLVPSPFGQYQGGPSPLQNTGTGGTTGEQPPITATAILETIEQIEGHWGTPSQPDDFDP